jgi:hypothetical protein
VSTDVPLNDDRTAPTVHLDQASPPNPAECAEPPCRARAVGHDQVISVAFSEPIWSRTIEGNLAVCCVLPGVIGSGSALCEAPEVELSGVWSQSADLKRLFFTQDATTSLHGLPFGARCRVVIKGGEEGTADGTFLDC